MIVGFTGTRNGMTQQQKNTLLLFFSNNNVTELHHGDCVGADAEAHEIAIKAQVAKIVIHPPIKEDLRAFCAQVESANTSVQVLEAKPYSDRNLDIVRASEKLIATPKKGDSRSGGTWHTVRTATVHKVPVEVLWA